MDATIYFILSIQDMSNYFLHVNAPKLFIVDLLNVF